MFLSLSLSLAESLREKEGKLLYFFRLPHLSLFFFVLFLLLLLPYIFPRTGAFRSSGSEESVGKTEKRTWKRRVETEGGGRGRKVKI